VVDQQPQIELGPVQMRSRKGRKPFLQRGARDVERIDLIGLAALAGVLARLRRKMRRDPQHPLAAFDQKPLQRARHVPAILKRPHAIVVEPASPLQQRTETATPTATVCPPSSSPLGAATAATVCERL
jgi:hypothetical protein